MAAQSTFSTTRSSQYTWFASIPQIGVLATTILEGLGEFGLASNGMCPSQSGPAASTPDQPTPKSANEPGQ